MGSGGAGDLDCCGVASKYIVFVFNFLILLIGLTITILGIVALANDDFSRFNGFDPSFYKSPIIIFLALGILIMFISFLGCCGAIKESKCMLLTYATIIFLIFAIVLVASILAVVFKDRADELVDDVLQKALDKYDHDDPKKPETELWDNLQEEGKCCGIRGAQDWKGDIPQSCCKEEGCTPSGSQIYQQGCLTKYIGDIEDISAAMGYVGLIFSAIMLLAIILTCIVGCSLH